MRNAVLTLLCTTIFFSAHPAIAQEPFIIQSAKLPASAPLSSALKQSLQTDGTRLITYVNGLETTVCELWWSKVVSTQPKTVAAADAYGNLRVGALLGVLYFPDENEDSRDQKIRPGFYTMRYAQIPQDSVHKDVSPYRDFVVLSPAAYDEHIDQVLSLDSLIKQGRQASRTLHPAVITLVPLNPAYKNFPSVVADDTGQCVLQAKLRGKSGTGSAERDIGVAILLVTPVKENGES
jgi:hypothetical protein